MTEGKAWTKDVDFIRMTTKAAEGFRAFTGESDRGSVLVCGAVLDEMLGAVLKAFFIRDKRIEKELLASPGAALSTFSSRINLCRALGLISEDFYRDLGRMREIRNQAAHFDSRHGTGFEFSFSHPMVADRCRALVCIPEDLRKVVPLRVLFEVLVNMSAATLKTLALSSRFIADNVGREVSIRMLLELGPAIDFHHLVRTGVELLRQAVRDQSDQSGRAEREDA